MKKLISFAVAGMLALSLAACGSSSSAAASSTESSAESTAASTADSAAADSDLAYLQNKGKMTIGYTVYEPMNYTDESGTFTGFDTELATAVCEKLGVEPEFVEINWDTKIVELDAKSIDCIWNGMTLTDEIQANAACTKAYAKNAQVVVMKSDADYSSTADLVGKTVVAEAGSAGESAIQDDESLSQADYVSKSVQTDCLMEVAAGTADAAVEKHVPVWTVENGIVHVKVGSVEHPMLPEHYIEWVSLQTKQGNQRKELHPGEKPEVCFALCEGDEVEAVYAYCNLHSLWKA